MKNLKLKKIKEMILGSEGVKIRWKVLVLSLVAQLVISFLLHIGIKTPGALNFLSISSLQTQAAQLTNPLPVKFDSFDTLKPKLEEKINSFTLKRTSGFVNSTISQADYNNASGYIVVDLNTGEVLAEKNSSEELPIASLTKIMTAVVALDLGEPEDIFTVSMAAAAQQPTKIGIVKGQKMSLEELLNASLLTSANDAVEVIKEGIDRKFEQEVFIKAMNEKAKILGLKSTYFENPQGLDSRNHYSSAEDLVVLTHYALTNYPLISEIAKKDYQFLPESGNHKQFDLYNWNGLLGVYPGTYGVKIGNTGDAGYTTAVVAERPTISNPWSNPRGSSSKVIVILLGAPGVLERDLWAGELLDIGFEKLGLSPVGITESELRAKYSTWKYWG